MIEIVQNGNACLRKIAKEVPPTSITKDRYQKIIRDMKASLHSQDDGVAIAAPQIALSYRIFVVSGRIFDEDFIRTSNPKNVESITPVIKEIRSEKIIHKDLVFINPVFIKVSRDKKLLPEGCLSVRPIYGKVRRATRATVEAYNEKGEKFVLEGSGLLAQIFQHEMDHLDGILFIDKAKNIHEATSEEEYK